MDILLFVVVITTAFFLYKKLKNTETELRETQQLFLQFIDHFEEQLREISDQLTHVQENIKKNDHIKLDIEHTSSEREEEKKIMAQNSEDPLSLQMRYAEIIDRLKEGKSIEEIAKEIGKGTGEVKLIIQLLETKKRAKTFLDNNA